MLWPQILYAVPRLKVSFSGPEALDLSGTGFWVSRDQHIFLVTNRHMFDPALIKGLANPGEYSAQTLEVGLHGFDHARKQFTNKYAFHGVDISTNNLKYSPNADNDIVVIKKTRAFPEPFSLWAYRIEDLATAEDFADHIHPGDDIFVIGYPATWYDARNNLPIVRGGFISSAPQFDYSDANGRVRGNCMAIESSSYVGSSGSPIIVREKGIQVGKGLAGGNYLPPRVIGVNAGYFPHDTQDRLSRVVTREHSGISYIFKSTAIAATIEQFN